MASPLSAQGTMELLNSQGPIAMVAPPVGAHDAMEQMNNKMRNYDKRFSPYYVNFQTVNISLSLPYLVLLSIKEDERQASWVLSIEMNWVDPRLEYNRTEMGLDYVYMQTSQVWKPRFLLYNMMDYKEYMEQDDYDVKVQYDGLVSFRRIMYANCVCEAEVSRFPFDTQYCTIAFTNPVNSAAIERLEPTVANFGKGMSVYMGNSEFNFFNISVTSNIYELVDEPHQVVFFVASLRRYPNYYIIIVVVPSFIIGFIAVTGALLPIRAEDVTDIVGLALATILALVFMLSIIADSLPKTKGLAWLGWYIILVLILSCIAFGAGFAKALLGSDHSLNQKPPGNFLRTITRTKIDGWNTEFDANASIKGNNMKEEDRLAKKDQLRVRKLIWKQVRRRLSLMLFVLFQSLNLLLLFTFFVVSWLPDHASIGISF